jgi:hypothetical protein
MELGLLFMNTLQGERTNSATRSGGFDDGGRQKVAASVEKRRSKRLWSARPAAVCRYIRKAVVVHR